MLDTSGQTPSQPNSGVSASKAACSAKQSTSQSKRKRATEDVSISGGCEEAADAGAQDATVSEDAELPPKKPKGRRVSATTRLAQQGKDWDSFQLMCKTLKSRDGIDDEAELASMWEQLDNCLRTLGLRNETHWYLRCKGGEQHSTICSFVGEWKASKEQKPCSDVDTSHEREEQATGATRQHKPPLNKPNSGATSSDHTHSKGHTPDGSTGHAPASKDTQASAGTGKRGSSAALAGRPASTARSDPQQGSSAARSGASVTRLPAHSGPSSAPRPVAQEPASLGPLQASAEASHFPEPRARPRPTGKTKSAAEVHKRSPGKGLAVQRRGERQADDALLCSVPKTGTIAAGKVTYIEVTNQAMLERTAIGGTLSKPALKQAAKSAPSSPPPGTVMVPCRLHVGPAGRSQLDDLREAYAMSSSSSEQSQKSTGVPEVASAEEAQPEAEAAADPSPLDPISVDPSFVDHLNVSPTSIDIAGTNSSADPQSADPKSVDPPGADPNVVSRNQADLTKTDTSGATSIGGDASGVDPTSADFTRADPASADPTSADPTSADPTSADPTSLDPTNADSIIIAPAKADTNGVACTNVDVIRAIPPGTMSMRVDPSDVDPTDIDPSGVDPISVDPKSADPTQVGPTSADLSNDDLSGVDPTRVDPTHVGPSTKGKGTAAVLEACQHVATAVAVSTLEDAAQAKDTPDWKAMYKLAMQHEANRVGLFSHEDAALKARKRLEFQDGILKTRKLVHDRLVGVHDDPVCDYVRLSLDTWAMVKRETQHQVAGHVQAVLRASEQLEKFHCTVVDMLREMPLPKLS